MGSTAKTGLAALTVLAATLVVASDYSPPERAHAREQIKAMVIRSLKNSTKANAWLMVLGKDRKTDLVSADEKKVVLSTTTQLTGAAEIRCRYRS